MRKKCSLAFLILFFTPGAFAQCVTNVDFNTWNQAGWVANGNWVVQGGGSSVHQTINGNPTFFLSPFELINVSISGNFKTTDSDDDMMGFVFSHLAPIGQSDNYNTWLFDWKQAQQSSGGYTAPRGKALSRLNGSIPPANYFQYFWGHQTTLPQFELKQDDFGGPGWVRNFNHDFRLDLTFTRATIYIDGTLVFDQQDCYFPGYFGFYNFSQKDCYYSNFQYELYIDFLVLTPQVCPGDVAAFQFLDPCFGLNFSFNQYQSLTWDYGDGTVEVNNNPTVNNVNPTHIYTNPGVYNVTLDILDSQGCTATATQQITVLPGPSISFTGSPTCDGNAMNFTDNSGNNPDFWQWDFGDGSFFDNTQNPSHTYAAPGAYTVELSASSQGCQASGTLDVTVHPNPVADFDVQNGCMGLNTAFTDQSAVSSGTITQWSWDFGDGATSLQQSPSHAYAASGNYNVTLVATTGQNCTDTYTSAVTVYPLPAADFAFTDACMDDGIDFTDQSAVAGGAITQWGWDFGDGTPPVLIQDPSHTFSSPGVKNVTLGVISADGCTGTVSHPVNVFPEPVADFTAPPQCFGTAIDFTDASSVSSGTIDTWDWVFGDGNTDVVQNPSNNYGSPGTYTAQLTVTTNNQCTATQTHDVNVNAIPVADFNFNNACEDVPVLFTDASTITAGAIGSWQWDFSDLPQSAQQSPTHTFATAGTYTVTLTVSSGTGCDHQAQQDITVYPLPAASFINTTVCEGEATQFTDQSTVTNSTLVDWVWDFDDGSTANEQNPLHPYLTYGNYNVSLTATTVDGCTHTVTQVVTVYASPVPDFTAPDVCFNTATVFTNASTVAAGAIITTNWDFDDGITSAQSSPQHTFVVPNTYTVSLTTITDNGCTETVTKPVTVFPLPVVDFMAVPEAGCMPLDVQFTNLSSITTGSIDVWEWNIESAGTFATQHVNNTFVNAGSYDVSLKAVSDKGCETVLTLANFITVHPRPFAEFTFIPQITEILYPEITFTDLSSGNPTVWNWDFGTGATDAVQHPVYSYPDTGIFTIELEIANQFGCTDAVSHTVIITPSFTIYVPTGFTPDGDGINDVFLPKGIGWRDYELRIFSRSGNQVFSSFDPAVGWNGNVRESEKMGIPGVYVWRIYIRDKNNRMQDFIGTVTLVR